MPNCFLNLLIIQGNVDERIDITYDFTFNTLVPEPNKDDYEWRMTNWGTKYEPDVVSNDNIKYTSEILFYTVETIPDKWLKTVSLKYPSLKFKLVSKFNDKIIITKYHNNKGKQLIYGYLDPEYDKMADIYFPVEQTE